MSSEGVLDVYFLDVGQADCAFLEAPDGSTMLIDAGNRGDFPVIDAFCVRRMWNGSTWWWPRMRTRITSAAWRR